MQIINDYSINNIFAKSFSAQPQKQKAKQDSLEIDDVCDLEITDHVSFGEKGNEATFDDELKAIHQQIVNASGNTLESVLYSSLSLKSGSKYVMENQNSSLTPEPIVEQNSITSIDGLRVDVSTIRENDTIKSSTITVNRKNSDTITFDAQGDIRLHERDDGSLVINFMDTGLNYVYAVDGSISESYSDIPLIEENANSIIIKLTNGSNITAGSGDDSILVLSDGNINAGFGDDNIVVSSFVQQKTIIDAGAGNDRIDAALVNENITINMSDGNDIVNINKNAGKINLGDGNNIYRENNASKVQSYWKNGEVVAGNGNNTISGVFLNNIVLGNGNNSITAQFISNIKSGDGDNVIYVENIKNAVIGNGNNNVSSSFIENSTIGDGNNIIDISSSASGYNYIGNGNNLINILSISPQSHIYIGDGNNKLVTDSVMGEEISIGNGDNQIVIRSLANSNLNIGNGNNIILGNINSHLSDINIGNGNNFIGLIYDNRGQTIDPKMTIGDGNNTIIMQDKFEIAGGKNNSFIKYRYLANEFIYGIEDNITQNINKSV